MQQSAFLADSMPVSTKSELECLTPPAGLNYLHRMFQKISPRACHDALSTVRAELKFFFLPYSNWLTYNIIIPLAYMYSLSLCLSLSLFLSLSPCLCLCLSVSLTLSLSLPPPPLSLSLCDIDTISVSHPIATNKCPNFLPSAQVMMALCARRYEKKVKKIISHCLTVPRWRIITMIEMLFSSRCIIDNPRCISWHFQSPTKLPQRMRERVGSFPYFFVRFC